MSRYEETLEEFRKLDRNVIDSIEKLTGLGLEGGGHTRNMLADRRIRVRLADLHPHQAEALAWLNAFIAAREADALEEARQQRESALARIDEYRIGEISLMALAHRLADIAGVRL